MLFFLQKFWIYIKKYWYILVIGVGVIVAYFIFGKNSAASLLKVLQKVQDLHKDELSKLEQSKLEEEKKKQENLDRMNAELHDEEEKYLEDLKKVEENKKNLEKQILEDTKENPEKLTDELGSITGISVKKP